MAPRPPSLPPPAADALATLLDASLVAMIGFLALTSCAPRQDLPWTQLQLEDPIGMATRGKLARFSDDPAACMAFLREQGVAFTPVADKPAGPEGFCIVQGGLTLNQPDPRLSPARPLMTCPLAAAYVIWIRQSVQPAAVEILGQPVVQVDQFGTYACRRVYNQTEGSVSTHAEAKALDVGGFRLKNGRRITVEKEWSGMEPDGRFLHKVRDDACQVFRTVLSPDYNAAHANHLHLDVGPYRLCR